MIYLSDILATVIAILTFAAGMVFLPSFIFWMISCLRQDEALLLNEMAASKTRAVKKRQRDAVKLIERLEIEEEVTASSLLLRKKNTARYFTAMVISLILTFLFAGLFAFIIRSSALDPSKKQEEAVTEEPAIEESAGPIYQLPDGTVVTENDVYLGADGQYYLKPEFMEKSLMPQTNQQETANPEAGGQ